MLRLIFLSMFAIALFGMSATPVLPEKMTWRGVLEVKNQVLRFEISMVRENGSWSGDFIIKGKGQAPLSTVELSETMFQFSSDKIGVRFRGDLKESGTSAEGEFHQNGKSMPLNLVSFSGDQGTIREAWEGVLKIQQMELPMSLQIKEVGSGTSTAYFKSLAENQTYQAAWTVENGEAVLEIPFIDLQFQGTLNKKGDEVVGTWRQPGRELDFVLKKQSLATLPKTMAIVETQKKPEKKVAPTPPAEVKAEAQDIPAEIWDRLAAEVQAMVDQEEIMGGELLVVQNRQPVFRRAFGWKDRERSQPMPVDAVYCVRSMTKPLVGTAIHMLMDEGKLKLDMPAHEFIPAFDRPDKNSITVEHLLQHTSGLPFIPVKKPLVDYADISEIVSDIATMELNFEPGTQFLYSDAGSITLGAIVSVISGMSVEQFIQQRILDPLGMKETYPLIGDDEAVLKRIPSAYSGGTGAWLKHWQPTDPPIFPIFLTSASLFSTTTDYARFLALWMDKGIVGEERLLSPQAVEAALTSRRRVTGYPSDFGSLKAYYGHQWLVYAETAGEKTDSPEIFGHDGSDGTYAWAWPERDLMVLFFTQSRGTLAGINLQRPLQKWLVERDFEDAVQAPLVPKENNHELAGLYWDETAENAYYVVKPSGDRVTIERPGKMYEIFKSGKVEGRYYHPASKEHWVEFMRNSKGQVTGMKTSFGGQVEHDPRHVPQEDLPSVEEVVAQVKQAHKVDRLPELGVVKMDGHLKFEAMGLEGRLESFIKDGMEKTEIRFDRAKEVVIKHRERAWIKSTGKAMEELEGVRLEQALLESMVVVFGSWTDHFEHVEVLKRLKRGERSFLLVRVVPKEGPGSTMYVDEASGMILAKDALVHIPGIGMAGVHIRFKKFGDVGGMNLPFLSVSKYSSNQIGVVTTTISKVAVGVETPEKTFLPAKKFRK